MRALAPSCFANGSSASGLLRFTWQNKGGNTASLHPGYVWQRLTTIPLHLDL